VLVILLGIYYSVWIFGDRYGNETQISHPISPIPLQRRQPLDHRHRFQADGNDLADAAHDILGIVEAVGVVGEAAAFEGVCPARVQLNWPAQWRSSPAKAGETAPSLNRLSWARLLIS